MSVSGLLPSGAPDPSTTFEWIHAADADLPDENGVSSSTKTNTDNDGFQDLEKKLRDIRMTPSKTQIAKGDDDDEPITELYFVRVPKPDFDSEAEDQLQKEFEKHLNQAKKLSAIREEKIAKKLEARKNTNKAWECLKEAKSRVYEKRDALKPYRDQSAEARKAKSALNDSKRGLAVSTEKQLNQLIRDLTFRLEHETISLAEEKSIAKQLTTLEASRPRVRRLEAENAAFHEQISQQNLSPTDKAHLEKELKELRSEQEVYGKMHQELKAIEEELNEEIMKTSQELKLVVAKKNSWYTKLSTVRDKRKEAKSKFQKNRDFSNSIRDLVREGRIQEAQYLCSEQTNTFMTLLMTNEEYKEEYMHLWEGKRVDPMAAFHSKSGKNQKSETSKKTSTLHGGVKVLPGQSLPDAVVANVLKDADAKIKKSANKKAPKTKPIKEEKSPAPTEPIKTEPTVPEVSKTPVLSKPKKLNFDPEFELPAVIAETTRARQEEAEKKDSVIKEDTAPQEQDHDMSESIEQKRQEAKDRDIDRRKKREEAAKRKKEREEAELKAKQEAMIRETQQRSMITSQKTPSTSKKSAGKRKKKNDFNFGKGTAPVKSLAKKQKKPLQKVTDFLNQYPILITSTLALIIVLFVFYFWFV
eukprot:g3455.t1